MDATHEAVVARGAALALGVSVETLMTQSTGRQGGSASSLAKAVIGPLRASDITATRAQHPTALLVSLSNDARARPPGVAFVGLGPHESVGRILEYAERRGVRRFSVLGDQSDWSRACTDAAATLAPRLDLDLATSTLVEPFDMTPSDYRELRSVDAVLIPPGGAALKHLAAPLAADGIQLLGTPQWGAGDAPIGGWRSGLDPARWRSLAARHEARFGIPASQLALLAHDAALVARAATSLDPAQIPRVRGATGDLEFEQSGAAWRGLAVLEVRADDHAVIEAASNI